MFKTPMHIELGLPNKIKAMLGAIRTGRKDKRLKMECSLDRYNARPNSAWGKWYKYGYDNDTMPPELTERGVID